MFDCHMDLHQTQLSNCCINTHQYRYDSYTSINISRSISVNMSKYMHMYLNMSINESAIYMYYKYIYISDPYNISILVPIKPTNTLFLHTSSPGRYARFAWGCRWASGPRPRSCPGRGCLVNDGKVTSGSMDDADAI